MVGVVMAFTDYKYSDGIFGSKWVGLDNFRIFFSFDVTRITRNTVLYAAVFIVTNLVSCVLLALLFNELKSRPALKAYQTIMIIPNFMSWAVVALIFYVFLDPSYGFINHFLTSIGMEEVNWYTDVAKWPFILVFATTWKGIGMGSIIYFAAIMGIDPTYYEVATIDGANKLQRIWHITIPSLIPLMSISCILSIGSLFRGDFGLFYQLPLDVGMLYPATDIIDTYLYRGIREGNFSIMTAVGLFQSVMGLILIVGANAIVNKVNQDNALF
ncbi:MAG: sugar ABC transporter permease [Ruminiclostridium sp.]|nr:sugar ABC transporter permease [Ruminiclostridium sp.]